MVRDKDRIYAEKNDPRTALAPGFLEPNKMLITEPVGVLPRYRLKSYTFPKAGIISFGKGIHVLPLLPNKILGVDANGELCWFDNQYN